MKTACCVLRAIVAVWLAGCNGQAKLPALSISRSIPSKAEAEVSDSLPFDLGPYPELSQAVERGEARPAGPITEERFRRWWNRAEMLVRIESQKAHIRYLRELLRLADESEQEFLDRIGLEPLYTGESAAQQLKTFQLVRRRVAQELQLAEARLAKLEQELTQFEPESHRLTREKARSEKVSPISVPRSGDQAMHEQPLSDLGLSEVRIRRLAERGIRTVGDLARDFYLPEQHELLAQLLEMDLASARALVRRAVAAIPQDELDALEREARQPRSLGVLPPEESNERSKP